MLNVFDSKRSIVWWEKNGDRKPYVVMYVKEGTKQEKMRTGAASAEP